MENKIFNGIFGLLTLVIIILFYRNILLATVLLVILAIIALIKYKSRLTLLIFLSGAIFGVIAEIIAIKFGVWKYSVVSFFEIPFWLFIVWGNAAIFIYHLALNFRKHK